MVIHMKLIKRCPKTGRIVGAVAGVAAIAWFLLRGAGMRWALRDVEFVVNEPKHEE